MEDLPYLFPPTQPPHMVDSIPSPMRLFTPFDMVVGRFGTAVWIDAQTDLDSPAQAGDHGQRIAGKVLCIPKRLDNPVYAPTNGASGDDRVSAGYTQPTPDELDQSSPVIAYDVRATEDTWNRLAVNEEEGRIAVSDVDGTITLLCFNPEDGNHFV